MFAAVTSTRLWSAMGLVVLSSLTLTLSGAGMASAVSTGSDAEPMASSPSHVLGMQFGTAAWLVLGLLLLAVGLFASSRSRQCAVVDPFASAPAVVPAPWHPVGDFGSSVSAV